MSSGAVSRFVTCICLFFGLLGACGGNSSTDDPSGDSSGSSSGGAGTGGSSSGATGGTGTGGSSGSSTGGAGTSGSSGSATGGAGTGGSSGGAGGAGTGGTSNAGSGGAGGMPSFPRCEDVDETPANGSVNQEPCAGDYLGQACDYGFEVCLCGYERGNPVPRWGCGGCLPDPVELRCEQIDGGICVFDERFNCINGCYRFDVNDNLVYCDSNGEDPTCDSCTVE